MDTSTNKKSYDESLILEYTEIIKDVAARVFSTLPFGLIDKADLVSEGIVALVASLNNYDVNKQETFSSYVKVRAEGAMKDFLRRQDILPQKKRIEVKKMEKGMLELEMNLGRKPTESETISHLNITKKKFHEIMQYVNISSYIYIDSYDQSPLERIESFEDDSNMIELFTTLLVESLDSEKLSDKHKVILQLHYYEELSFKHISSILNLSTARVSQLHSQAIKILRKNLHCLKSSNKNNYV